MLSYVQCFTLISVDYPPSSSSDEESVSLSDEDKEVEQLCSGLKSQGVS